MAQCSHEVDLIITRQVDGTATNIARERLRLRCESEVGHAGPHRVEARSLHWHDGQATLVEHERAEE